MVIATDELQGAILVHRGQVACLVQNLVRIEWRGHEALGRQVIPLEVSAGHGDTPHVNLPGFTGGHGRQVLAKQVNTGVVNGFADWRKGRPCIRVTAQGVRRHDMCFRGPVLIYQYSSGKLPEQVADGGGRLQLFAGGYDLPQVTGAGIALQQLGGQQVEHDIGKEEPFNP